VKFHSCSYIAGVAALDQAQERGVLPLGSQIDLTRLSVRFMSQGHLSKKTWVCNLMFEVITLSSISERITVFRHL
jgi:hypothetical protein